MTALPPDPFGAELEDFLPMAMNAKKMYESALLAGFTEKQAMEWMIRICSAMVTTNLQMQADQ